MKASKVLYKIFKLLVVVFSLGYIGYKLNAEYNKDVFFNSFEGLKLESLVVLVLTCSLVYLNWAFESIKFKILLKPIQTISIKTSFKAVLAGVTVSIFTPKRIGDFGGRIFALETKNRVKGIFASLLGSYSQSLITIFFGLVLLPLYLLENKSIKDDIPYVNYLFLALAVVILLSLIVYFNIPVIGRWFVKIKYLNQYKKFIEFVENYSKTDLMKILIISAIRYVIFTFQMFMLLKVFGIEIGFINAVLGISQIYLFMFAIPTVALGELGVRGSLSIWLLGVFSPNAAGILMASVSLWVLNLAIPAIIGNYFLLKFKY